MKRRYDQSVIKMVQQMLGRGGQNHYFKQVVSIIRTLDFCRDVLEAQPLLHWIYRETFGSLVLPLSPPPPPCPFLLPLFLSQN